MVFTWAFTGTGARADVLVLQSSAGPSGAIIRSGAALDIPAGRRVILLHADGQTQVVVGPLRYLSPVAAASDASLLDAYSAMFRTRKDPLRLGGVRAGSVASCRGKSANPWVAIAETWNMGCHREALGQLEAALAIQA
ncbi:hypothetical protein [Sandarakinorhabdus sp.]|uniref:hypothetical protein n=1 Tax=Sandarakinorhabdus sp. TaxID=1916663 RepID=UPI00286D8DE7|nr:hypothetical protein [Sandarakinorhabdus sp.]